MLILYQKNRFLLVLFHLILTVRYRHWQFRELFEMTRARITDVAVRVARVVRRMSGMSKQDAAVIMDYYRDGLETARRLDP